MTTPSTPTPTDALQDAMPEASRRAAGVLLGYLLRDGHSVEDAATQAAALIEGIRQDTLRFAEDEAIAIDAIGQYPRHVSDADWLYFCANDLHPLSHDDRVRVVEWLRFQREGLPENEWVKQRRLAREAAQQADTQQADTQQADTQQAGDAE